MDRLAEALGLDPLEIRLRNAAEVGSTLSTGQVLEQSVGLKETLRAAAQAAGWHGRGKGVGIACCLKNVGLGHGSERDKAAGAVDIHADGRIVVRTGAAEVGQGLLTVLAKIAATELGARFEDITVCYGDTKETPDSGVTSASRQTFMSGNACSLAARQVRAELLALAAPILGVPASQLECGDSAVCDRADPSRRVAFGAVAATAPEGTISHEVLYRPPETHLMGTRGADGIYRTHATYGYGTQIAFVEVNEETGCVTVKKIVAASDVGRALFPKGIVGQTVGGVVMGLGYALSEEYRVEDGVPKTRTLAGCRVPRAADVPEIEVLIVEDPEPSGPLGAKGTGELPVLPTAPAIANDIYDAIGIRFTELPITRRKVLEALKKKAAAG